MTYHHKIYLNVCMFWTGSSPIQKGLYTDELAQVTKGNGTHHSPTFYLNNVFS